jgi:hypothetical protein
MYVVGMKEINKKMRTIGNENHEVEEGKTCDI